MGLFEKLRAELIDIIEWVDDSRHTLVWRFPRYHNQIKHGAQLIVRPGQVAVFVSQGRIADVFEPGHYTLETRNLPVLSTLAGWPHGFDSPFKAEVYFCSTRQITDLKWGTPNPIPMRDADFGPIRIRAFGTYTLRASDPKALLQELVGTDSMLEAEEVQVLLRSIVSNALADLIANSDISVVDLASSYQELSEKLRRMVLERVDDEYGLDIPQLYIVNVSVPEEVEKALDVRTSMRVIEDLAQYQQYQIGHAIPTAAASPAGGLAGAGLGLGMGAAVAGQMIPGLGAAVAPQPTPPQAPPPPPLPTWHVAQNGQSTGPFTAEQLAQAAAAGNLGPQTLVWTAGMAQWTPASQVPQLAGLFAG
ncbi:MAG: SPFH domain-containing protein [Myxococcota bacterium]|nr:SPFH domain-containing protein [Myxococcota bacterium]